MEKTMINGQSNQMEYQEKEIRRTRRVGSVTCGLMLVLYGILFMVHIVQPKLNYYIIFEFWPLILIFLGVEILVGSISQSNEKKKLVYDFPAVILIFVVAFFAMVMSGISYYYEYYSGAYDASGTMQYKDISGTADYAAGDVGNISLSNEFWDIRVLPSEDNDIHVAYSGTTFGNKDVVKLSQVNGGLAVDISDDQTYVGFHAPFYWGVGQSERIGGEVQLYLPESDTLNLNFNSSSGDMQLKDVSLSGLKINNAFGSTEFENIVCNGDFSFESESGEAEFNNVSCDGFSLNNSYGDVKIEKLASSGFAFNNESGNVQIADSSCGDFKLGNNFGNIRIERSACGDFELKNDSGDVNILDTSFNGFSLNTDYGEVSVEKFTAGDVKIVTNSGNVELSGGSIENAVMEADIAQLAFDNLSAKSLDIDAGSGDIYIRNADAKAETSIKSDYGNIRIKYREKPKNLAFDVKSDYGNIKVDLEGAKYDYDMDSSKRGIIGEGTYHTSIVSESGNVILED